jgi:hypothetical protein
VTNPVCPLNNDAKEPVHMNMNNLVSSTTETINGKQVRVEYRNCSCGNESGSHKTFPD